MRNILLPTVALLALVSSQAYAVDIDPATDCASATIRCVGTGLYDEYSTIQAAINASSSGDLIAVNPDDTWTSQSFTVSCSGVTLQSYTSDPASRVSLQGVGYTDPDPPSVSENIIYISGDNNTVQYLNITYASKYGIFILGDGNTVQYNTISHSYDSNICVGEQNGLKEVLNNTIRYNVVHHSRIKGGINMYPANDPDYITSGTVIDHNLSYSNGYMANESMHPYGGNNSDGIATQGTCQSQAAGLTTTLCPNTTLTNNIVWRNTDDGIDISIRGGKVWDNIAIASGPTNGNGFKGFQSVQNLSFVGNLSVDNSENGYEARINTAGDIFNNTFISNTLRGYYLLATDPSSNIRSWNNLGYSNPTANYIESPNGTTNFTTNWWSGSPGLADEGFVYTDLNTSLPSGETTAQWTFIRNQFIAAFTPTVSAGVKDAGTYDSAVHCPTAGATGDCRTWYGTAPDIGAFEYNPGGTGVAAGGGTGVAAGGGTGVMSGQ